MRLHLLTSSDTRPDFLALPLHVPLAAWSDETVVRIPTGVHRHVVRFIGHEERLFALKELPPRLAWREWRLLRHLADEGLPVVELVGVIADRGPDLDDLLITCHLEYSLPFRFLFTHTGLPRLHESLIDAIAVLLVRLHLIGFFWGDCSLSNTLFRRDAGALSAYVVDVETGELHPELTDGQRALELDIAQQNVLGGLLDLDAMGQLPGTIEPVEVVETLRSRYEQLWAELTEAHDLPVDERWRIDERLRRLNELGFDTEEIELVPTGASTVVRFRPIVVEAGHHRRLLERLTGVVAQENQARRLLNDLWSYKAYLEGQEGRILPEAVAAYRWLTNVFEPAVAAVPPGLTDRREPAEVFHEVLAHRDALVAERGVEVRVPDAARHYAATVLPDVPTERSLLGEA